MVFFSGCQKFRISQNQIRNGGRKMKKVVSVLVFLSIVLTIFLSGCAPAAQAPEDQADVELIYWSMWNPTEPQALAIQDAVNAWSEETGVTVNIAWKGREIRKLLQPALEAGQVIDIFDEDIERVNVTWGDFILNVEEYVTQTFPTTDGRPYNESVNKALLALSRDLNPNGALSAIPYQPFLFAFMYNKDSFDAAGIDSVPTTWDEFLEVCEKLKAAGITPMTVDDAYMDTLPGYHLARLVGHDRVREIVTNELWDDPAVLRMASDWEEMFNRGFISPYAASNVWPSGQQEIADGSVAMYLNGTWLPNEIRDATGPDFRWGTFSYPALEGGVNGIETANFGSQVFAINKDSEHPDQAFELIVHLTTGEWDSEIASRSMGVPVGLGSVWPPQLAEAKTVFDNLEAWFPWAGGIQSNPDLVPFIVSNFTKLISGEFTAEEFISEMKKH